MADFARCMPFVEHWEGGFADDPKDPGGATRYGISLRFLRALAPELGDLDGDGDIDADDVLALTPGLARGLYRAHFWDALGLDHVHVLLALPLLDTAVNMGIRRAVTICQETVGDLGMPVAADGVMGPKTRAAALHVLSSRHREIGDRFCMRRLAHYSAIVAANDTLSRFLRGWVNRTTALAAAVREEVW